MDFNKARDQFRQAFTQIEQHVREDWQRSRSEASSLWSHASSAAKKMRTLTAEVATEMRVDLRLAMRGLQKQLISPAFETHLDEILTSPALKDKYEAYSPTESDDRWFARVHASLCEDELEESEKTSLKVRRERVGRKLSFLFQHYRDDVLGTAKTGAILGGILGPRTAIRLAMIAGGMKLVFIVGGVTYTVLVKENGDWSMV